MLGRRLPRSGGAPGGTSRFGVIGRSGMPELRADRLRANSRMPITRLTRVMNAGNSSKKSTTEEL